MQISRYLYNVDDATIEITDTFKTQTNDVKSKVYITSDEPGFDSEIVEIGKARRTDCTNAEIVEVYAPNDSVFCTAVHDYIKEKQDVVKKELKRLDRQMEEFKSEPFQFYRLPEVKFTSAEDMITRLKSGEDFYNPYLQAYAFLQEDDICVRYLPVHDTVFYVSLKKQDNNLKSWNDVFPTKMTPAAETDYSYIVKCYRQGIWYNTKDLDKFLSEKYSQLIDDVELDRD